MSSTLRSLGLRSLGPRLSHPAVLALAVLVGCRSAPAARESAAPLETRPALAPRPEEPRVPAYPARELPDGWDTLAPAAFEQELFPIAASEGRFAWSASALGRLVQALGRQDASSVRAAVLLAHSGHPSAADALVARLEARAVAPQRGLDAGDVVAAAALAGRELAPEALARLVPLAIGPAPHPDLEVRVEIARAALAHGDSSVVPFLVRVLRALTPAEAQDPPDWERVTTLAWAKSRAAEALSARLGEPCRFRPDGSWADQMAEAERLEAALGR